MSLSHCTVGIAQWCAQNAISLGSYQYMACRNSQCKCDCLIKIALNFQNLVGSMSLGSSCFAFWHTLGGHIHSFCIISTPISFILFMSLKMDFTSLELCQPIIADFLLIRPQRNKLLRFHWLDNCDHLRENLTCSHKHLHWENKIKAQGVLWSPKSWRATP